MPSTPEPATACDGVSKSAERSVTRSAAHDSLSSVKPGDWIGLWVNGGLVWSRGFDYDAISEGYYEDD